MPLRQRASHVEAENVTLTALRDVLLPELLAGRVRVPEAEEMLAGVGT